MWKRGQYANVIICQCANRRMIEASPETWTLISLIMNYALSIMNYHLSPDFWLQTKEQRQKTKDKRKSRASSRNSELNLNSYSPSSNFQSRKLSGQIFKLIIINCFQNSKLRTLTPPPSGTPLKIRGDHRYAGFSAINNRVEAWSICQCDNMSMCQS